jgi:alpha-L-fucosidase 2
MMKYIKKLVFFCFVAELLFGFNNRTTLPNKNHDLFFSSLAKSWDEGIPLGNGMLGAIVWQKGRKLRLALDRADLWDLREAEGVNKPEYKYSWVIDQVNKNNYSLVQKYLDKPYDVESYPTKIPATAIEFEFPGIEKVKSVSLSLRDALCVVKWNNGITLSTFVNANKENGWFLLKGIPDSVKPRISPPPYSYEIGADSISISGPEGNSLERLGYSAPIIKEGKNEIIYHQKGSEGMSYDVMIRWQNVNNVLVGWWTIKTNKPYILSSHLNDDESIDVNEKEFTNNFKTHSEWWNDFWEKSSIKIPDQILEKQYYRELYKFGCASRKNAPPITLQAIWTADNNKLPPWKGDFHNDLNTQLSYWPSYCSNHLVEASSFTDWLWYCKVTAEDYTKNFFGVEGLNFPGVSTLTGEQMGGWTQYSSSPTVSAWLSHHFYLQWRYSMDEKFLRERAYPWVKNTAQFLNHISIRNKDGKRNLPLSSSPEINDNKIDAWFKETTNYDLALIRWLYKAASEMAKELKLEQDAAEWNSILREWPELSISTINKKLLVAPNYELKFSHRHFSQLMAIHPLGLLNWDGNENEREIISSSIKDLERLGTEWWCGYSYAWLGNIYARAEMGEKAAEALRIFSTCFCLPNSFHVNGDQTKSGKSNYTYRPFTLEGNFAFASGVQEMLLQSQNGLIKIFPAIPKQWENVSFQKLRAEGAFVISAEKKGDKRMTLKIFSENGGKIKIKNPFNGKFRINGKDSSNYLRDDNIIIIDTVKGETFILNN